MNGFSSIVSWHDYQGTIPATVTHLRIGFIEYQKLLGGNNDTTTTPIELPHSAFCRHPNLKSVQIYLPAVSRIGEHTFSHCPRLEQVEFVMKPPTQGEAGQENVPPSRLVSIGICGFLRCKNLQSVIGLEHANASLQEIGDEAFAYCESLVDVDSLPSLTNLQYLGIAAFGVNQAMTNVNLSRAVHLTELKARAFAGCTALAFIHLPQNLVEIGDGAFWRCSVLEHIHVPPSVQIIGSSVFGRCYELKSIVLPSALQHIGQYCFGHCGKLSQVELLPWVPFLKQQPFPSFSVGQPCSSLCSLEFPTPVPRQQWPLILEQFCKADGIASKNAGIRNIENRNTIVWNFLCKNMAQLFIKDNAAMSRRRPLPSS